MSSPCIADDYSGKVTPQWKCAAITLAVLLVITQMRVQILDALKLNIWLKL